MSRLEVIDLTVARGGTPVLHQVGFAVPSGRWCGLIGVNGAGKTTLLRAIAGRLPVQTGDIRIDGQSLVRPEQRAARIGLSVPGDRLPDAVRVDRLIAEVARAHGAQPRPERLAALWTALALNEIADRPIGVLSQGQRQRVGVWLAFSGSPEVVLLDEPFNALDPLIAFDLKRALSDLAGGGLTIVTALHDLPTVALHCGHGLLLSHGRLAESFDSDALADARRDPGAFESAVLERWRRAERRA